MAREYKRPMFSKRHYSEVAGVLRATRPGLQEPETNFAHAWRIIVSEFACEFARDNPRFSEQKFLVAAGFVPRAFDPIRDKKEGKSWTTGKLPL